MSNIESGVFERCLSDDGGIRSRRLIGGELICSNVSESDLFPESEKIIKTTKCCGPEKGKQRLNKRRAHLGLVLMH